APVDAAQQLGHVSLLEGGLRRSEGLDALRSRRRRLCVALLRYLDELRGDPISGEDDGPLEGVFELTQVAAPGLFREQFERLRIDGRRRAVEARRELLEEVVDEQREVLDPIAQGRHLDLEDVEAEVE